VTGLCGDRRGATAGLAAKRDCTSMCCIYLRQTRARRGALPWEESYMEHLRLRLARYLEHRWPTAVVMLAFFVLGTVVGALSLGALGETDRLMLVQWFQPYMEVLRGPGGQPVGATLGDTLGSAVTTLGVFWLLSATVVGTLALPLLLFARGFVGGFVVAFLSNTWGLKGVVFALAAVLPQNLLAVPALLLLGGAGLQFGLRVLQARMHRRRGAYYEGLRLVTREALFCSLLLMLAALWQVWISPALMGLAAVR
jgi:stage II sporulation protein M